MGAPRNKSWMSPEQKGVEVVVISSLSVTAALTVQHSSVLRPARPVQQGRTAGNNLQFELARSAECSSAPAALSQSSTCRPSLLQQN